MRLLTYLVGCSIDSFTAGPDRQCDHFGFDGDLKAAVLAEYPETVPDHARTSELITATTDTGNTPMAAAFARAGYRTSEIRMLYSAPVT
ncbi:hypothetical protein [Streptomyces sp. NPDC002763]|uniref:hypothetical protein n=1 Tax=Streptomyces sp. NPDC002763 TaxID=3154427 RepID=UPI00332FCCA4